MGGAGIPCFILSYQCSEQKEAISNSNIPLGTKS